MSSAEFAEWRAFQRLEGLLGPERDDWRVAMVASVIANASRDQKKRPKPYEPQDFIPDWAVASGAEKATPHPLEVAEKVKGYFQRIATKARAARQ